MLVLGVVVLMRRVVYYVLMFVLELEFGCFNIGGGLLRLVRVGVEKLVDGVFLILGVFKFVIGFFLISFYKFRNYWYFLKMFYCGMYFLFCLSWNG